MTDTADLEMCYICQNSVKTSKNHCFALFTCVTQSSNTKLVEKVSELAQGAILVSDTDIVCRKCFILLNTIDKLQSGLEKLKHEIRVLIESRITNYEIGVNHVEIDQAEATLVEMDQNGLSIMSHVDLEDGNQMVESSQPLNDAIKEIVAEIDLERPETSLQILETQEDDLVTEKEEATPRNRKRKRSDDYQEEQNDGDDGPYEEQQEYIIQDDSYGDQDQVDDVGEYIPDVEDDITQDMPEEDANNIIDDVNDKTNGKASTSRLGQVNITKKSHPKGRKLFFDPRTRTKRRKVYIDPRTKYPCKYCPETFEFKRQCFRHEWFHMVLLGLEQCDQCEKVVRTREGYESHQAYHRGEFKCFCDICGQGFMTKIAVKEHRTKHTGKSTHVCETCGKSFRHSSSFIIHKRIAHLKIKPKLFICDQCGQSFYISSHFKLHLRKHLPTRTYQCKLCPRAYYRPDILKEHMCKHTNVYLYNCKFCNKSLHRRHRMLQHLQNAHSVYDISILDQCKRQPELETIVVEMADV